MRTMLVDYAGHPFQYDLSAELGSRGQQVLHSYSASTRTPQAKFADSENVTVVPVSIGREFERFRPIRRLRDELEYGIRTAVIAHRFRPDRLLMSNVPVVSLAVLWGWATVRRIHWTLWLQDLQSGLARIARGREGCVSRTLRLLEYFLIRRAPRIVAISDEFAEELARAGVPAERVSVIGNWAPIDEMPRRPRNNPWSAEQGLDDSFVFLYSGTLGMKHSPALLKDLAEHCADDESTEVVVVAEGAGADWLSAQSGAVPRQLPLQPFESLPDVLGTADCLIVLLDAGAAGFSVPSKTLSYLCAGRPILGAVPAVNAAARLIGQQAEAGLVVDPDDRTAFLEAADKIRGEMDNTRADGARAFAEREFQRTRTADRFEAAMQIPPPERTTQ